MVRAGRGGVSHWCTPASSISSDMASGASGLILAVPMFLALRRVKNLEF